ncbi:MAG: FAD-dependent oxidoreductase [Proteobacteria bacterium]|nr:FAD-dependent oxidoreductase [Pseudomonadota bacterium]
MRVGIVGGGVIGLSTAYYLRKLGANPVIIESSTLGSGCSLGNAGWVFPSLATPLPAPGLTLKSLLWLLRRDSPLYIRPAALPVLAPWLMRFRSFCNHADQQRGIAALAALNAATMERYDELAADGVQFEYYQSALLMAFRDADLAAAEQKEVKLAAASGIANGNPVGGAPGAPPGASTTHPPWRELDEAELYEREPMLRPGFRFGLSLGQDRHLRPESLTGGLGSSLRAGGVEIHQRVKAAGFRTEGHRVAAIVTSSGDMEVDAVVLAAGAHTGALSRMAGWPIPLTAGKGYSITIEQPANQLRQPLYLGGVKIGLSPFNGALRIAGTMELSGINTRMDKARIRSLRRQVNLALDIPEIGEGGRDWVGMRPVVPDGLPVIGKLPSRENVYVNTGHQMLGITLAPSSGRALAGLILEGEAGVELEAFSAARF